MGAYPLQVKTRRGLAFLWPYLLHHKVGFLRRTGTYFIKYNEYKLTYLNLLWPTTCVKD